MPLTPADIHNMAFKKPPMGKRGYDEEEVDAFLDEVEQELIRLLEENGSLRDRAQRGGPPPGGAASTMVLNSEFAEIAAQLERAQEARARAEQSARNTQDQLERARRSTPPTPPPIAGDDDRNQRVLAMAQRTADDHMRDAEHEAEQVMGTARSKAEQITSEAEIKAATIESDARRNHSEALSTLTAKRSATLDEIDRLGMLARSYQTALNDHVTQQLRELNSVPAGDD